MKVLNIDIETFSSNDLKNCGVYKYVEAKDFEILLFAYSIDGAPVQIVDLACGEELPREINHALLDPTVLKTAFNAQFERVCISKHFLKICRADQWECSMVKGAMLGLPFSLDQVGKVLQLNTQKDSAGKALIRYFSIPCKPTASNGMRTRNLPIDDFEKWESFKAYCVRDVETELAIREKLSWFTPPEKEVKLWQLDQKINDTGIGLEPILIKNAIQMNADYSERMNREAVALTGLDNPNSTAQLKSWINEKESIEVDSLNKDLIPELIKKACDDDVKAMLKLRQVMAKSSIKKYQAMMNYICMDARAHGLTQYYGANRTGRFAGRGIQIQNLPRIYIKDIDLARNLVYTAQSDILEMLFESIPDTLSQLIRTAFRPTYGNRLIVADFSAIELIVIAWLAGEKWVIDEYQGERKIYEQTAARMLGVPVESITKDSPARQKGKIASLACQYQGSVGALVKMGAVRMGLTEDELPEIIARWRGSNKKIVAFWSYLNNAAIEAVDNPGSKIPTVKKGYFQMRRDALFMGLPSGRELVYPKAELRPNKFGGQCVVYQGLNSTKQWSRIATYGGLFAENMTQAVARDLLAEAMLNLDAAGYNICGHVHDEVIIDQPKESGSLDEVIKIMTTAPKWAKDLPIAADGFESEYYKK